MKFYIAVLESDCEPHYYKYSFNAMNYLTTNAPEEFCTLDPNSTCENGELWNRDGISVGYFYSMETEDENDSINIV